MDDPIHDFDSYFGQRRAHCSGGIRFFEIKPDGAVSRCAHFGLTPFGNILDEGFRMDILTSLMKTWPCENPTCVASCGGLFTEQVMPDGVRHTGIDPLWKGLIGNNYVILGWSLTHICNYTCAYCSAATWMSDAVNNKRYVMSVKEVMEVSRWFVNNFNKGTIAVLGGEPLIHPAFEPMAIYFLESGWIFEVITNMSLSQKLINTLEAIPESMRSKLRIIFSAHVHQEKFNAEKSRQTLLRIKEISPKSDIRISYVTAPENTNAMSLKQLQEFMAPVVKITDFIIHEDMHIKLEKLAKESL